MRITITQARENRIARQNARKARVAERKAARAAHRAELHTVASHLYRLGVDAPTATGMASTIRKRINAPGVKGFAPRSLTDSRKRSCTRYTRGQVLAALADYKPRKEDYRAARARILGLAA